ncbi:MAG: 4'-phosphopantetheinyl transferase superfamily protein [Roseburia sp.]|nr:4'-phosphopantetheinyl transferase superfamily protein [Roseburia sp.]
MVEEMRKLRIYAAGLLDAGAADLMPLLDKSRREKLAAIRNPGERQRCLTAGLLLRHAFLHSGYSREQWRQAEIVYGEYGKPGIRGLPGFHYSISHSEEWVICAVGDIPVGADIQRMRPWKIQMARRFYSDEEYDRLVSLTDAGRQTECFYQMWAAKESYGKLTGRGIGEGVSRYVTDGELEHIRGKDTYPFPIRLYDTIADYIVCVCSREACFPEEIIFADLHEILRIHKVEG